MSTSIAGQQAHDFDFIHGTWHIRNRRLRAPLSGSTEWYEFDGRAVERPRRGGPSTGPAAPPARSILR